MIDLVSIKLDTLWGYMTIPRDLYWRLDVNCSVPIENYWFARKNHVNRVHPSPQSWCRFCQGHWSIPLIEGNISSDPMSCRFPSGLIERVCTILDGLHITYDIEDSRVRLTPEPQQMNVEWRDYQQVLAEMWAEHQTMSWSLMTGGGKSALCLGAFAFWGKPGLILVHKKEIQNEFVKEADKFGFPFPLGTVGDQKWNPDFCTVAMVQTLHARRKTKECIDLLNNAQFLAVDECFTPDTLVHTEDGPKSIYRLVRDKYSGRVWSWSQSEQRFELQKVVGWIKQPLNQDILRVTYGRAGSIKCTANHRFLTTKGWRAAKELSSGDAILSYQSTYSSSPELSPEAKQIIYGSILGDGSVGWPNNQSIEPRLCMTQHERHKEYLQYKSDFLTFLGKPKTHTSTSGYTHNRNILQWVFPSNLELAAIAKMPITELIRRMGWLAMAIWYLDDGSITEHGAASIGVYSRSDDIVEALLDRLHQLGVSSARKLSDYRGPYIHILKKDMEGIFGSSIAQYVPDCMLYKIPQKFHKRLLYIPQEFTPVKFWTAVNKIHRLNLRKGYVYCLDVEANHNFLVGNSSKLVVENCHHLPAKTWYGLAQSIPAPIRYGQSATIQQQGKNILWLEGATGPLRYTVPIGSDLVKDFHAKPEIFITRMPCSGNSNISSYEEWCDANIYSNDALRKQIVHIASKHKQQQHKLLVFNTRVGAAQEMAQLLSEHGIRTEAYHGSLSAKQRKAIMAKFETGGLDCLSATQVFDEGVNIPAINVAILATGGKSETQLIQRIGRAIRPKPGDNVCYIYDFYFADGGVLENHSQARLSVYKKNGWKLSGAGLE